MVKSEVCRIISTTSKNGAVLVTAQVLGRPAIVYSEIPLMSDFNGLIAIPKVNQKVVITKPDEGPKYVEGILTSAGSDAPDLGTSEFALQFDPETRLVFQKDGSGGFDLNVETSGNISIEAGGNVTIGQGENATKLARQDHTHDYDDTGDSSDGSAGTTTKTTSTTKEPGTETTVE